MQKKVVLCILDGWGVTSDSDSNGTIAAKNWHNLLKKYPNITLQASELAVGLPKNQMGNSEVGHAAIGLGRILLQDLPKIDHAFEKELIQTNPKVLNTIKQVAANEGAFHVMGLLSPGGIHSHIEHILKTSILLAKNNIPVFVHAFLDGRDSPPQSAAEYLQYFINETKKYPLIQIASISGRYYAMDRDNRFDRTEKAYNAIICANAPVFENPIDALLNSYNNSITDEFFIPQVSSSYKGAKNNDGLWMVNFRADRVRQILKSILFEEFNNFHRNKIIKFGSTLAMNEYADFLTPYIPSIFPKDQITNGLGEILAKNNLKQLRIAETEKYAHVTFFFNGGIEKPFFQEERILVPSPKVATYDFCPEMSAKEVTQNVIKNMSRKDLSLIVVNFANTDMVGHTGVVEAIKKAVECVDLCVQEIAEKAISEGWVLLITSDHGNAELMFENSGAIHTAHTCNPVPFVIISNHEYKLKTSGNLSDIAPTILEILNLEQPKEITGKNLLC